MPRLKTTLTLLALVFSLAWVMTTCGRPDEQRTSRGWVEDRAMVVGELAPDFRLPMHRSEDELTLSGLRGQVVMVNFWGAWCGWCRRELPHLVDFADAWSDSGVMVVGVLKHKAPGDTSATDSLIHAHGIPFRNVVGFEDLFDIYGLLGVPTTVVVDADGVVRDSILGYAERDRFEAAARRGLNKETAGSPSM